MNAPAPDTVVAAIKADGGAFLRFRLPGGREAILRPAGTDDNDAREMARWRRRCWRQFFSWIRPEAAEVRSWLAHLRRDPADLTAVVHLPAEGPVAQMALCRIHETPSAAEFGRVIKGGDAGEASLMSCAAAAFLRWGIEALGLQRVFLEVFKSNRRAVGFYRRIGFRTVAERTFRKEVMPGGLVRWVPQPHPHGPEIFPEGSEKRPVLEMEIRSIDELSTVTDDRTNRGRNES